MSEEKLSLDIGINANSGVLNTLIAALDKLSDQLGGVTSLFSHVTGKVEHLGKKSQSTAKDVHKASNAIETMGEETKKTKDGLGLLGEKLNALKGIIAGAFTANAIISAGEHINTFNKAVRQTGIEASSFQVLRESAQTVGVSFDELSDGVKEFQRAINSDGDTASQVFKKLGVAFKDSNGKIRETSVLLRETGTALNNMQDKGARTALAEQVGLSYELVDAISNTSEEWENFDKRIAEGRALTQDDLEQSEIFRRTFASMLLQLQQISEKIFATLAPIFNFGLKGLKPVIDVVAKVIGAFSQLVTFLNKITNGFWLLIPAALALIKVFPLIKAGIKAIGTAILANPILFGVTALIIGIIAVIEDLYVWMNGGKNVFGKWMEEWGIFPDDMKKMIDTVIDYFSGMWEQIKKDFTDLSKFLTAFVSDDWDTVIDMLKQAFFQFIEDIKTLFSPLFNWISDKFQSIVESVKNLFGDAWDLIKGLFSDSDKELDNAVTRAEIAGASFQQASQTINHISSNSYKAMSNNMSQNNHIHVNVAGSDKAIGQKFARTFSQNVPPLSYDQLTRGGQF